MSAPVIASVSDVSKRFILHKDKSLKERLLYFGRSHQRRDDFWALHNIDLEVDAGTTLGLVGHNGSGKSTLLKVIGGIIEPTSGQVKRRGRLAALLELGAGFHPDLSGRENVYLNAAILGLSRQETDKYFDSIVAFAEIEAFIDTQVKFYSSGMYVRLAFAVAVHVDPDLLLVDEVLAVGDEPFQRKCLDKIAEFQAEGRTIIFVSHSAEQIARMCNRVAVLEGGHMIFDGEPLEGLSVLRDHYARAAGSNGERSVDSPYHMRSVRSELTGSGENRDLVIDVAVHLETPLDTWGLTLSLYTTAGMRVFTTTTQEHRIALPSSAGDHTVTFRFPGAALGAGSYIANLALGDGAGNDYDHVSGVGGFTMGSSAGGRGVVRLQPQITVSPKR